MGNRAVSIRYKVVYMKTTSAKKQVAAELRHKTSVFFHPTHNREPYDTLLYCPTSCPYRKPRASSHVIRGERVSRHRRLSRGRSHERLPADCGHRAVACARFQVRIAPQCARRPATHGNRACIILFCSALAAHPHKNMSWTSCTALTCPMVRSTSCTRRCTLKRTVR
jgi:hypothetical protein